MRMDIPFSNVGKSFVCICLHEHKVQTWIKSYAIKKELQRHFCFRKTCISLAICTYWGRYRFRYWQKIVQFCTTKLQTQSIAISCCSVLFARLVLYFYKTSFWDSNNLLYFEKYLTFQNLRQRRRWLHFSGRIASHHAESGRKDERQGARRNDLRGW